MTEFWMVGGAVRDIVLGLGSPTDVDFVVETESPFEDFQMVLESFGVLPLKSGTFLINDELKTARATWNGAVNDFKWSDCLDEDLSSRDFTMNAMALGGAEVLLDPFDGVKDFESGVLRTVGEAQDTILRSPERLIRAARFSQKFDLEFTADLHNCFRDDDCLEFLRGVNKDILLSQLLRWQRDSSPVEMFWFMSDNPKFAEALLDVVGFSWKI